MTAARSIPTAAPKGPRPGRPSAIGRETILRAAIQCLGEHRSLTTLSLREVARAAGIAPNSIYRHFASTEDLAVAVIELSGESLRHILNLARHRVGQSQSVIQMCTETFFAQLAAEDQSLKILLREGHVGPAELRAAVERQLVFFETELQHDLLRLAGPHAAGVFQPAVTARAITRLVFTMSAQALDVPAAQHPELIQQTVTMVRLLVSGSQAMAAGRQLG